MRSPDSREATLRLVRRDRDVPLAVLLDDAALTEWLAEATGTWRPVRRRYLRYKPGVSCLVLAEHDRQPEHPRQSGSGRELLVIGGFAPHTRAKLDKSVQKAGGSVVAHQADRGLVVLTPAGDRHLPGLRELLCRPGETATRLLGAGTDVENVITLAYKPHRRWVGRIDTDRGPILVRAYRKHSLATSTQVLRALQESASRAVDGDGDRVSVQRVLGRWRARGLIALEWARGEPLDQLLGGRRWDAGAAEAVRGAGAALAGLHGSCDRLPVTAYAMSDTAEQLRPAASALAGLCPALGGEAFALMSAVQAGLDDLPADDLVLGHGDFSVDQVVMTPAGPVVLDLDRAGLACAAEDFGSFLACLLMEPVDGARVGAVIRELSAGYRAGRQPPDERGIAVHAAAQLLRRACEPFRRGDPDWYVAAVRALQTAQVLLRDGINPAVAALPRDDCRFPTSRSPSRPPGGRYGHREVRNRQLAPLAGSPATSSGQAGAGTGGDWLAQEGPRWAR